MIVDRLQSTLSHRDEGQPIRHRTGYLYERSPGHPYADLHGRVLQHRRVVERAIGRFLLPTEVVHHLNGRKNDNAIENLELHSSNAEHLRSHSKRRDPAIVEMVRKMAIDPGATIAMTGLSPTLVRAICVENGFQWIAADETRLTASQVTLALQGRTTQQAADLLGVSHGTLRRNFPGLLTTRQSPGFLDSKRKEICANAMKMPALELAKHYRTTRTTMNAAFLRWSKAGVLPTELAEKLNADGRRKSKLQRKVSTLDPKSE